MDTQSKHALVLLSGGLDSSTLLYYVRREQNPSAVSALSFHYGQRHARELDCARLQASIVGVAEHIIIDMGFLGGLLANGSSLVTGGQPVPDFASLKPEELDQPPTYVPNRNMILLAIAAGCAEARGIQDVYYGAQAMDAYGYWDCTPEFVDCVNRTLGLNRRSPVTVHAPFTAFRKADTVRLGARMGVDFAATWSCYRGGDKACGSCPTCVERLAAFREAGLTDPLPYLTR